MKRTTILIALLSLICIFSCANGNQIKKSGLNNNNIETTLTEKNSKELKKIVNNIRIKEECPSLQVSVIIKGKGNWSGTFGNSNLQTGEVATNKTLFQIGSISKNFTSAVTLMLIQDGRLSSYQWYL